MSLRQVTVITNGQVRIPITPFPILTLRNSIVPKDYATRVCNGFAQLGARGVSVIFSSGDSGVGDLDTDPTSPGCKINDGTNRTMFIPGFPAGCP